MAKAERAVDVEDVLSSIRRLVSEEADQAVEAKATLQPLVLTPEDQVKKKTLRLRMDQIDTLSLQDDDVSTHPSEHMEERFSFARQETGVDETAEQAVVSERIDADLFNDVSKIFVGGEINQDALKAFVAACVREELMGDLGERITRNVRKLVRKEIQRAIISKDFE